MLDRDAEFQISGVRPWLIRLLQDLSCSSDQLPDNYWLLDIEETDAMPFARGGQAQIRRGVQANETLRTVVALRMHDLPMETWSSQEGKDLIQVRRVIRVLSPN